MLNFNRLLIEAHRFPEKMKKNPVLFMNFLDTMAKYHRYDVTAQINFHHHALAGARALARESIWNRGMKTALAEGAVPIPVLLPDKTAKSGYVLSAVYDVQDTVAFQSGEELFQHIPWQFDRTINEESTKNLLGEASAASVDEAVHNAIQKKIAVSNTGNPEILAAAVEYIARTRMGLPFSRETVSSISLEGIANVTDFLTEINRMSRDILDTVGQAVKRDYENGRTMSTPIPSVVTEQPKEKTTAEEVRYREKMAATAGAESEASQSSRPAEVYIVSQSTDKTKKAAINRTDSSNGRSRSYGRENDPGENSMDSLFDKQEETEEFLSAEPISTESSEEITVDAVIENLEKELVTNTQEPEQVSNENNSAKLTISDAEREGMNLEYNFRQQRKKVRRAYDEEQISYEEAKQKYDAIKKEIEDTDFPVEDTYTSPAGETREFTRKPGLLEEMDFEQGLLESEHRRRHPEIEEQEKQDKIRQENSQYHGFLDNVSPRTRANIMKALDKTLTYDDGRMSRKEQMEKAAALPDSHSQIKEYAGKKEYQIFYDKNGAYLPVTKTEYDYFNHLRKQQNVRSELQESESEQDAEKNKILPKESIPEKFEQELEKEKTEPKNTASTKIDREEESQTEDISLRPIDDSFHGIDLNSLDFEATMSSAAGKRAVFLRNLAAIQIVNHLDKSGTRPNEQELKVLKAYSGFGGIPEAFDSHNSAWASLCQLALDEMTPAQYRAAKESTLTAFYTPHEVIGAIYEGLQRAGFTGGNILDPSAGTGRFLDDMPDSMKENSHRFGVELDSITAQVAKYANPGAAILNKGFEKSHFPDGSFDLSISNVPFGNFVVNDKRYEDSYLIHDYFLKRMMDQTRPGGLVAVITSAGTMDKKGTFLREEMARKGELVRAIRFPNSVFKGAGTETVSDLLIFRKREKELGIGEKLPDWVHSAERVEAEYTLRGRQVEKRYMENPYFLNHPQDILGEPEVVSTPWGYRLDVKPKYRTAEGSETAIEEVPVEELLSEALSTLPKAYAPLETPLPVPAEEPVFEGNVPYGFYFDKKEIVYLEPTGKKTPTSFSGKIRKKIISAMELRDEIRAMFDDEMKNCDDETLANHQAKLESLYEAHVKEYGPINNDKNLKRIFREDSAFPLLLSLESMEDDKVREKSDIFTKRTIHNYQAPEHADTAEEALMISVQEKGGVDIPYMTSLTGKTSQEIVEALEFTSIYEDLETNRYMMADEYLSGDVRKRLELCQKAKDDWEKELLEFAKQEVFGTPDHFTYDAQDYPEKFATENMKKWDFEKTLSKDDVEYLFDRNNRALLLHYFKTKGPYSLEQLYKNRFLALHPERKEEFSSPEFALSLMPSGIIGYQLDNLPFDNAGVISRIIRQTKIPAYDQISDKDYLFMQQVLSEFAQGEHPEVLEREALQERYEEFQDSYEKRIKAFAADKSNALVAAYRKDMETLEKNIAALEKVQPKALTADEINVHLGASWVPPSDIEAFAQEVLGAHCRLDIQFADITGEWKIGNKKVSSTKIDEIYGMEECNALVLLERCLNHRIMEVKKITIVNGEEKTVTDRKKTLLAAQKMQNIRNEFSKWIFQDETRKKRLVEYYNRHFNNIVPRQYDGSKLTFPNMNPEIKLRPHQKDAIAHSLYGGNTLFAHVVGAGKTFEMQASAMESKRIGLCKKPMFIMPKHLTEQFGAEFIRLYPNAKLLISTPKDSGRENRQKFSAKIAAQDWDAIIMSYEQFEKIPLSAARRASFLQKQIDETMAGIEQLKLMEGNSFTVKQGAMQLKKLKEQMEKITNEVVDKQDATITFEQLGVDRLYVDESHNFKNLQFYTKMTSVSSGPVQKTADLMAKIDYLNEITKERGVVFASGTPISNSFSEFYTLQRYLKPSRLESQGLKFFDFWASTFGQETTQLELSADGKKYNFKTRFAKFDNLPELVSMYREFADVRTADMLDLNTPDYEIVMEKSKPSEMQKEMVSQLVERAERIKEANPIVVNEAAHAADSDKGLDNMLVVINDGRNVALDPRIVNSEAEDFADSKVNRCAGNVARIYKETREKKSTQLVFCDLSTPKDDDRFTVYSELVKKMQAAGIPADEIAVIHDYEKPEQKEELFKKVRKGEIRVLLGSSDKLGIGTNVQDRLIATHDLDCPWKPSQIEQRRGRIVRSGNQNKKVTIYRYVTEGTFDAYMWQTNERKQGFISQIMSSKNPSRSITDIDSTQMEFAEFKAACTDNPLFKEQMELTQQVEALTVERVQYNEMLRKLKPRMETEIPQNIHMHQARIEAAQKDLATMAAHDKEKTIQLNGREVKLEEAGKSFAAICQAFKEGRLDAKKGGIPGEYKGIPFKIQPEVQLNLSTKYFVKFHGQAAMEFLVGLTTPEENLNRLKHLKENLENKAAAETDMLHSCEKDLESCRQQIALPFPKEEEYQTKNMRLAEINAVVSSEKEIMELEAEKKKRMNMVKNTALYTDNKNTFKVYLMFANEQAKAGGEWTAEKDDAIAMKMKRSGYRNDEIQEAIYYMSPDCPDKEELKARMEKKTMLQR